MIKARGIVTIRTPARDDARIPEGLMEQRIGEQLREVLEPDERLARGNNVPLIEAEPKRLRDWNNTDPKVDRERGKQGCEEECPAFPRRQGSILRSGTGGAETRRLLGCCPAPDDPAKRWRGPSAQFVPRRSARRKIVFVSFAASARNASMAASSLANAGSVYPRVRRAARRVRISSIGAMAGSVKNV